MHILLLAQSWTLCICHPYFSYFAPALVHLPRIFPIGFVSHWSSLHHLDSTADLSLLEVGRHYLLLLRVLLLAF